MVRTVSRARPAARHPAGWRAAAHLWWVNLHRLRVAPAYAALVYGIALWLHELSPADRHRVIFHASTNAYNLSHGRWWVLLTSCVVSPRPLISWLAAEMFLLGLAELLWGQLRAIGVFLAGNVLASLIVYVMVRTAIDNDIVPLKVAFAPDVGSSYGMAATLGALVTYIPGRVRTVAIWLLLGLGAGAAAIDQTFTDVGHAASLVIGVIAGLALRRWHPTSATPTTTPGLIRAR